MHKWKLQFLMVLSCPDSLASAPSRGFQGTIYDYVGVTYIPISVLHDGYILKMKNLPGFSPIFIKKIINCWYFVEKTQTVPLFILISVTWLMHSNDISNIIYFSFWWHCWREDCSRYLHSRLCSQVNVLGEGYRPATVRTSAPSRKVSAPSRKVTELRVMEIVSFLKYNNKMRIKMNGVNNWIHCC